MYSESPKKMRTKARPLVLMRPLAKEEPKSVVLDLLRNGPPPDRLSDADIATLFSAVTKTVYGAGQPT